MFIDNDYDSISVHRFVYYDKDLFSIPSKLENEGGIMKYGEKVCYYIFFKSYGLSLNLFIYYECYIINAGWLIPSIESEYISSQAR